MRDKKILCCIKDYPYLFTKNKRYEYKGFCDYETRKINIKIVCDKLIGVICFSDFDEFINYFTIMTEEEYKKIIRYKKIKNILGEDF